MLRYVRKIEANIEGDRIGNQIIKMGLRIIQCKEMTQSAQLR